MKPFKGQSTSIDHLYSDEFTEHIYQELHLYAYQQQVQRGEKEIGFEDVAFQNEWECSFVVDYGKGEVLHPKGFDALLGYSEGEIDLSLIIQSIHPDDVQLVSTIFEGVMEFLFRHPEFVSSAVLSIAYRRKKKNGNYRYILSESMVRSVDETGRVRSTVTRNLDVSFLGLDLPVQWTFKSDGEEIPGFKEEVFGKNQAMFTERELEVIQCMKKSMRNKEIAEELNISEHTVATHRKRILSKTDTHCHQELMDYCRLYGIT